MRGSAATATSCLASGSCSSSACWRRKAGREHGWRASLCRAPGGHGHRRSWRRWRRRRVRRLLSSPRCSPLVHTAAPVFPLLSDADDQDTEVKEAVWSWALPQFVHLPSSLMNRPSRPHHMGNELCIYSSNGSSIMHLQFLSRNKVGGLPEHWKLCYRQTMPFVDSLLLCKAPSSPTTPRKWPCVTVKVSGGGRGV